ncbi:DNA primase DnaG [Mycobacteroides abscessus]|nr:DNA primase DnaG [Mycobacteroides abscessus]
MAGRIPDRDIAAIRERTRIEDIVGDYVQLKRAGADSLKGLCPFHDEKSPSFHVRPNHGHFHCFGCGEGGDAYTFIQKIEHITFVEAVERLADRIGYTINYEGGGTAAQRDRGTRARLVAANAAAQEFYAAALDSPEAAPARQYLTERNFDGAAAKQYGCGFAPSGWDTLTKHLMRKGFEFKELEAAGLSREGRRGPMDRFHRRLLWPIRASSGEVIGFGARKIFDDDTMPGKYVNTPETMLYKKSSVLFGLDLAKRDIAKGHQAVVVEGYTDVMAMHLAGVTTAVASCGTAFGDEHLSMLRRLMMDDSYFRGELIYVFDGDAAGQAAALKAFEGEQNLAGQSFVAVAPDGMDPCDLRLKSGEGALRDLVARRIPLFAFAIRSVLAESDLEIAEGRVDALRRCVPMVAKIKDPTLRDEYARQLAGWVGWDDVPRCWHGCVRRPVRRPRAALCPRIVVPVAPRRRRHPRCRCPIPRTPRCGRSAKLSRPRCSSRPSPVRCSTR